MQRKKSQHNGILKESFENIIISKKELDEYFGKLNKAWTKATTVLNTRETRITLKLSMDMTSPPWKLLFEALFLTKLSLKMWKGVLAA
jgi:ribosome-associated toxin RatA of RatAB toxin-antitoxin module